MTDQKQDCFLCKLFFWVFIFSIGAIFGGVATVLIMGGY